MNANQDMNITLSPRWPDAEWPQASAEALGFNADKLEETVAFAISAETPWPRDLSEGLNADLEASEPPPWNEVLGPTRNREAPHGMVIRHGQVAASWGDVSRADMTYSATKSYLALLAGIAVDDGLIKDIDDRVSSYAGISGFSDSRNREITWRHLLQQTSEWTGELWSKPDLVDHHRQVGPGNATGEKGTPRALQAPGTFWEYNDVRVNRLSLSLMELFKAPLEDVLRERIMEPIGASNTWRWHGYHNAIETIDGRQMQGVSGGAHWGGGLFISSLDHARVGWLVMNEGRWNNRRLLSRDYMTEMLTPCALNDVYGYLWWLNTGGRLYPSAPHGSYAMFGAGYNLVWMDPSHDLLCVMRWIDSEQVDDFLGRVVASLVS